MAGYLEGIDPWNIEPIHDARDEQFVESLSDDMEENGWSGRPLLVVECETKYLAWTGSHRIAAARQANLPTVPCYVIDEQDLIQQGGYEPGWPPILDHERLELLTRVGDDHAIELMHAEEQVL